MKAIFFSYSDLIMVDATYKLNEFHMPLYLFLIVDDNGQSEFIDGIDKKNVQVILPLVSTQEQYATVVALYAPSFIKKQLSLHYRVRRFYYWL